MKNRKLLITYHYWNSDGTKGTASIDFTYDELKEYKFENLMSLEEFIARTRGHETVKAAAPSIEEV